MALLLLALTSITFNSQCEEGTKEEKKNVAIIEGILAAPLSACSSYELAHVDEVNASFLKTITAFLRLAHGITFQINHQRTYAGLKAIMGLLTTYDAVTFAQQYKQLVAPLPLLARETPEETEPAPPQEAVQAEPENKIYSAPAETSYLFSDAAHAAAHQIELAAALVLAMSTGNNASNLRCEYAACLAMIAARCVTIAEQHRGLLPKLLIGSILSLMVLDFIIPNSPFNNMLQEREQEFNDYLDLQEDVGCCMKQLSTMRGMVDTAISSSLTRPQHDCLTHIANGITKNRSNLRATMCTNNASKKDTEITLVNAQTFYAQNRETVVKAYDHAMHTK